MNYINKTLPTIMLMDHELAFTSPTQDELSSMGYQVDVVNEPVDALTAAKHIRPKIILLDFLWHKQGSDEHLEAVQGMDLLDRLKAAPELAQTRIFFLSDKPDANAFAGLAPVLRKSGSAEAIVAQIKVEAPELWVRESDSVYALPPATHR